MGFLNISYLKLHDAEWVPCAYAGSEIYMYFILHNKSVVNGALSRSSFLVCVHVVLVSLIYNEHCMKTIPWYITSKAIVYSRMQQAIKL